MIQGEIGLLSDREEKNRDIDGKSDNVREIDRLRWKVDIKRQMARHLWGNIYKQISMRI